jgi:ABC-2 type transport system ATP-binding protein
MTDTGELAVSIESVSKRFGRVQALDAVSLDIKSREMMAILGPNGAGKSTLILILCTLLEADAGRASVAGIDVRSKPREARRRLGVVFQESTLDTRLTVEENLEFHGRVFGVPGALRKKRIAELLDLVELGDTRNRLVRTLSAGMRRRVEIARALVHDSSVLILDEPTVGLDAQSRARVWDYLRRLQAERDVTIIVTTHYIEEVDTCDHVCIIDHGKVLALDTPGALRSAHGEQSIRVETRDAAATQAIRIAYPDAVATGEGAFTIVVCDDTASEALLRNHAQHLRSISIERSSLESVFLNLTGREIREQKGGVPGAIEGRVPGQEPRM